jgi:hypothetical protein
MIFKSLLKICIKFVFAGEKDKKKGLTEKP